MRSAASSPRTTRPWSLCTTSYFPPTTAYGPRPPRPLTRNSLMTLTCIHTERGLCPACQSDYDADPLAYLEYGDHPEGLANYQRLLDEIAQAAQDPTPLVAWDEIPF